MSKCPKCEGKGFIEFEHGLVMMECDECGGTKEVDDGSIGRVLEIKEGEGCIDVVAELTIEGKEKLEEIGCIDGSIGDKRDNQIVRGGDTGQPELKPKLKAKKKATRGAK